MAKLIASKQTKANGDKFIAGYKVSLPKTQMERCGFHEGDDLVITYKREEIRIKKG